jgi:hypothetical protein
MLQWFDSTATLVRGGRDGMVDMSGLDSGDALVVWVQVPSSVISLNCCGGYNGYFFFDLATYM